MAGLVVEEEIGLELAQELAFLQAAEEHRLVDLDIPLHQRADRALVRRRAAGRDERSANAHAVRRLVLQPVQGEQERLERAGREGSLRLRALMRLEGVETALLEDALGFVREENRVAVEGDADFLRMPVGRAR